MKIKYELVAPFTSIFCEYILQASSNHLDDLARVKGVTESNKSTIMPYFFGFEVKAYFDFGIYFWVLPSQMINQLDVNSFISSWMPLKGDIPEQAEEQEQKLLYPSPKGEYFGFVSKCNLSGQLFGNPQIGSKIKLQYKEANQEIFTMKFGEQRLLNSNNSNFVNKSNIFDKTNPFKSSIIEDTFFDDQIMRKYCGYQQYGLDTDDNFEVYEGYWKNDLFSYQGCFRFSNGARYEGGYKKGKKHGYGVYYSQLGPIYAGQFVYNQIQGIGKLILDENQIYYGTFHNGMRNGFGELYYEKDNEVMLMWGQWENNKQQGHGKTALSSLPHIYMKANYENDEIEGDVIFNVTESSQHSNEEKRIFQYKAIWINSRRVTPYILVSKSTKSKEENRQILIHQKSLEQFEALYNSFKYSIISVARDIGKCKNNKNY